MTDRELLERAAKVAGLLDGEHDWQHGILRMHRDGVTHYWNPLIDDADALRLAVRLKLSIDIRQVAVCVIVGEGKHAVLEKGIGPELALATRRAIVRAAAASA